MMLKTIEPAVTFVRQLASASEERWSDLREFHISGNRPIIQNGAESSWKEKNKEKGECTPHFQTAFWQTKRGLAETHLHVVIFQPFKLEFNYNC